MQYLKCPGGEIGRRTVFRSQRLQGCDGSNPFLGTKIGKGAVSESEPSLSCFSLAPAPFPALIMYFYQETSFHVSIRKSRRL